MYCAPLNLNTYYGAGGRSKRKH